MFVFSTPQQVVDLKQRSLVWEKDGFPGIDDGMQLSLSLLNKFPHLAPVYSCTGHIKTHPTDPKRRVRSDFYVIFAATEEGFNILRDIYQRLQDRLIKGYTEAHNEYKRKMAEHAVANPDIVKVQDFHIKPVSRPNLLRLSHTVRVWPISTAGGDEGLHDGDTTFYNVALLAAETGNAHSVIKSFLNDFTEVVVEVAQTLNIEA